MDTDRFDDHEVIAEVQTGNTDRPRAVLCKATNPTALGADKEPWVVWPLDTNGQRGPGNYHATFEDGWLDLGGRAKR